MAVETIAAPTPAAPPQQTRVTAPPVAPMQATMRPQSTVIEGHEPEATAKTSKSDAFAKLDSIAARGAKAPEEKVKPPVKEKLPKPEKAEKKATEPEKEYPDAEDQHAPADDSDDREGVSETKSDIEKADETKTDTKPVEGEKKKVNPWRLADEWKKKAEQAQRERDELKQRPVDDPEKKVLSEKLTAKEQREKELVDELRFYNYEKHDPEFKKTFDEPYKAAWVAAVDEISQFPVTLADGTTRGATADDLLRLVNLPPVEAREMAEQMFGKYADDILRERKLVREKFDARQRALTNAKTGLAETMKAKEAQMEAGKKQLNETVGKLWEQSKKLAMEHETYGEYFKPIEGDQDGNLRLSKGYELVERAFAEDASDPNLTGEKRADIIKRHAIVYHRAAAFGRVLAKYKSTQAKVAALEKELAAFKESEPGGGEGKREANGQGRQAPVSAMAGAWEDLTRRAR